MKDGWYKATYTNPRPKKDNVESFVDWVEVKNGKQDIPEEHRRAGYSIDSIDESSHEIWN